MKDVHLYAIVAGTLLGIWPLLMNRSGLDGFASATFFTFFALTMIIPVALWSGQLLTIKLSPLLLFAVAAGVLGGLGVLFFNTMLAKVSAKEVGMMFILMIMFQLAVPTLYHMVQSGDYSLKKMAGVAGAFIVAYLLA